MKRLLKKYSKDFYTYLSYTKQEIRYLYHKNLPTKYYPKILENLYKKAYGKNLDINNPLLYSEKMQWAKLYDNHDLKSILTDKLLVRDWVKNKVGEKYLIPLLGSWDSYDEIDFDQLPNRFVLKANHGAGWNIIVKNKDEFDIKKGKEKFDKWMKKNKAYYSFEMQYEKIKPKIIAEKYIENNGNDLQDFKFLCFNGTTEFCWIDIGRYSDHRRNVYDVNWNLQRWQQHTYLNTESSVDRPKNYEEMIHVANILSSEFSHVRVDLYNVNGEIYFGEMTFSNSSGLEVITPSEYDMKLGEMWVIKSINEK